MKNHAVLILPLLVAGLSLSTSAQTVEELKLNAHSAYNVPASARNPFWPVGWQKPPPVVSYPTTETRTAAPTPTPVPEVILGPENFSITSISTGNISLAVVNGKAYAEGELIPIAATALGNTKVEVLSIRDGVVTFRYKKQLIPCHIKGYRAPEQ